MIPFGVNRPERVKIAVETKMMLVFISIRIMSVQYSYIEYCIYNFGLTMCLKTEL